jgi:hypothetical protein
MEVQLKVGSVLRMPVLNGWSISSSDTSILTAVITGRTAVLTAIKAGIVKVTLNPFSDLAITLTAEVTTH